jgi:hypothetical protein
VLPSWLQGSDPHCTLNVFWGQPGALATVSKEYEKYFGIPYVLLVYLAVGVTTEYRLHRLHTMREMTRELLRKERISDWGPVFRFSTIDESLYDTLMLFTDPVCYQPDSDTLVSLFPPPEDEEEPHDHNSLARETDTNP